VHPWAGPLTAALGPSSPTSPPPPFPSPCCYALCAFDGWWQAEAEKCVPSIRAFQELRRQAASLQICNDAAVGIIGKCVHCTVCTAHHHHHPPLLLVSHVPTLGTAIGWRVWLDLAVSPLFPVCGRYISQLMRAEEKFPISDSQVGGEPRAVGLWYPWRPPRSLCLRCGHWGGRVGQGHVGDVCGAR
jgi:hypothetical protein